MKKHILLALTIVLTASLFTGCGCTDQDAQYTTAPTTRPTIATTAPTTQETSRPTMETTQPTIDRGNGALENTTAGTTDAADSTEQTQESRTRQMQPSANTR